MLNGREMRDTSSGWSGQSKKRGWRGGDRRSRATVLRKGELKDLNYTRDDARTILTIPAPAAPLRATCTLPPLSLPSPGQGLPSARSAKVGGDEIALCTAAAGPSARWAAHLDRAPFELWGHGDGNRRRAPSLAVLPDAVRKST